MRHLRRHCGARLFGGVRPALLSVALGLLACVPGPAVAREVVISGSKMNRFGRILLQFDEPTKVDVRQSNSVVVVTFAEPARIRSEKLATELAPYLSVVRRDPDNTGLRLALSTALRVNVLEAGERIYIDLLPKGWTGLPPSLPPEVVAELARRAQAAEAKLKAAQVKRQDSLEPLRLRAAELPSLTRLVLEPPAGLDAQVKTDRGVTEIRFPRALRLDMGDAKPKLAAGVALFEAASEAEALVVRVKPAPGYGAHTFSEAGTLVVDLAKPSAKPSPAESAPLNPAVQPASHEASLAHRPKAEASSAAREPARPPGEAPTPADGPRGPAEVRKAGTDAPRTPDEPAAPRVAPSPGRQALAVGQAAAIPEETPPFMGAPPLARAVLKPVVTADANGLSIVFPFRSATPAAAYQRAGNLTVVFDTPDVIDRGALRGPDLAVAGSETEGEGLQVLRFSGPRVGPARLVPAGSGWKLAFGQVGDEMPPDALRVVRALDGAGHGIVRIGISGASRAHWLREPDGVRAAVVTALGRVQALPISRSFVEFALAATLHGLVIETRADDVTIGLNQGGVTVSRDVGLTLSSSGRLRPDGTAGSAMSDIVLGRDFWLAEGGGDVLERLHGLLAEAANAPRSGQAEARFRVARFLVANGMNQEASGALALARAEDPVFARRRETSLLSGVAAVRAGRPDLARAFLSRDAIGDDAEAVLWRGMTDAAEGRWSEALAGFRKSSEVVELYADDLAGPIRLQILKTALQAGDVGRAERELTAIDRLPTGSISRDDHDLARASVDEAAGRTDAAVKAYARLMENGDHHAASDSAGRWIALGLKSGFVDRDTAIRKLEALSVTWRGGEIEIGTITHLARLYGEAERWREMFAMTRRANHYFPDHPLTRALHDESAQLLERLLLGTDRSKLKPVQALALYFDFKELAPIGRRGDEVVRRLADRLVELDLLGEAAELLQYQVDNRLTGLARATVAARLAAIRLLDGKPLLALSVLRATRLAEVPQEVRRFRFLLEARAQSDLGRGDLALETLEGESGPDFDRLRAGILWTARRWREAGEAGEALLGTGWSGPEPLTDRERRDVIRAAIAYALADERLSLDRVRQKFSAKMMDSPDAKTFELLMRPGAMTTREFREAAQASSRADSLQLLLADWRGRDTPSRTDAPEEPPADDAHAGDHAPKPEGTVG